MSEKCWTEDGDRRGKQLQHRTRAYQQGTIAGARGVMVIVIGNGHGDTSSNPGRDWLHFT